VETLAARLSGLKEVARKESTGETDHHQLKGFADDSNLPIVTCNIK